MLKILKWVPLCGCVAACFAGDLSDSKSESYYHFLLGTLAALENNTNQALQEFQKAAQMDPSSSLLKLRQAEQLLDAGDTQEAKALIQAIATQEKTNPEFHLLEARLGSQENNLNASLKALDLATEMYLRQKQSSKARETMLTKVALLADHKKYEESIKTLERYLKTETEDEIALYFLGKIHSLFQNRKAAKAAFSEALEIRPSFLAASKALGLQLELEGKIKEALQVYQRANRFNSSDEELLQKLVNLSLIQDDYASALDYLTQYLMVRPDDAQSELRAALIHYKLKHYDQAAFLFEDILHTNPANQDRIYFYLGSLREERGEYDKALEAYQAIPATSEYFTESRLQTAEILSEQLKKSEDAIEIIREAMRAKPESSELPLALAAQYEKADQVPAAIRVLTAAADDFKDHEKIVFMLGTLLDRAGDFQAGVDRMKEVLKINPNNAHALNHIGYAYAERKINLSEAEENLKRAVQLAPDNGFILDSLGWTYFQQGNYKKAVKVLEKANGLSPKQAVILEHLADAYQKAGMKAMALATYRNIMKISAESQQAKVSAPTSHPEVQNIQERVRGKLASLDATQGY